MISIIIPTKNEPGIDGLVQEIHRKFKMKHEVIIVDESNNCPVVRNAKILIQKSHGLGNAIKEGLPHTKGSIIVIMDGDGSHRPEDISKLIIELKKSDIAVGSRFVLGGKTLDVEHRKLISFVTRKFASFILNLPLKDSMSGFAAVKRNVFDKIKLNPLGYKIVLEIAYKAKKKGFKISEVPIVFLRRRYGETKVKVFSLSGISELLRIIRLVFELKLGLR